MSLWRFIVKYSLVASITSVSIVRGSPFYFVGNNISSKELEDVVIKMLLAATNENVENGRTNTTRIVTLRQDLSNILGNFDLSLVKDEVSKSLNKHLTCNGCFLGLGLINVALTFGTREKDIKATLLKICVNFQIQPEEVCTGIIDAYQDEVFFILSKTPLSTGEICAAAVGNGCGQLTRRQKWMVLLPKKAKPLIATSKVPQSNVPTSTILHISDTHVDFFYTVGAQADCPYPLCCRADSIAGNSARQAGQWGDYGKCDIPPRTMEHMFHFITQNHKVDYIFWTGDIPPHDVWKQTREEQLAYIQETMNILRTSFPRTRIFPVMGNHESVPPNSFPPSSQAIPGKYSVSWLYEALLNYWKAWLPEATYPTILKGGYYALQIKPGLRVISVNTNFCYFANWWLLLNFLDPGDQLRWLVKNLQDAEDKKDKVYIIGHIPPGYVDCGKVWSANFYNIINRYESTVVAQFYGHTHADEFEVFYDQRDKKRATNVAYVGPSVTTYDGLNPAYRLYTVAEDQTCEVLDHETYMMDVDEANRAGQPSWRKLYSAKEAYKLPSLRAQEWGNLVIRMRSNKSLFDLFYRFYHRNSSHYSSCSTLCRNDMICALKSGKSQDPNICT